MLSMELMRPSMQTLASPGMILDFSTAVELVFDIRCCRASVQHGEMSIKK
jgi:hypothetical protein